eukprot:6366949-Karenia_brevis.AAC.1
MIISAPHDYFLLASLILGDVFFFANPCSLEAPGAIIFIMHGVGVKASPVSHPLLEAGHPFLFVPVGTHSVNPFCSLSSCFIDGLFEGNGIWVTQRYHDWERHTAN